MEDLRWTVNKLLAQWGLDVYLQRRIYQEGVGLYSEPQPDPTDQRYWSPKLEKYTVRMTFAGRKLSLSDTQEERPEGWVHTIPLLFYFPYYARPTEGDRIYVKDKRYPNEMGTYIIFYASPTYGRYGKVTFYVVGTKRELPR